MPATQVTVREAAREDIEALLELYAGVAAEGRWIGGEAPVDVERGRSWRESALADDRSLILVAEVEGAIVGELGLFPEGGGATAHLGMEVAAGHRGRGIGRALMEAAIAWARERGFSKIFLYVWPHNEAALALYEKCGFAREGYHPRHFRRRNGEVWDAISMGLLLGG